MYLLFRIYNQQMEATVTTRSVARHALDIKETAITFELQKMCSLSRLSKFRWEERWLFLLCLTFFLTSLNSLLFLKSCFLSSKMQLMTEQQISHSSIWTSRSKPAQRFWTCCWWKKMGCQIGHLLEAILNHMIIFWRVKTNLSVTASPLLRQRVLRNPLSSPRKYWF